MDVFISGAIAAGVLETDHAAAARAFAERLDPHRSEIQKGVGTRQVLYRDSPIFW